MATVNLEELKASGVYTFEYDASQSISQVNEYGRLAIGSSKTGPFNTIVSLQSDTEKKAVFGQNDKTLEKKGSFFHKSIEVLLGEGDVYAINILPIDVTPDSNGKDAYTNKDRGYYTSFSTASGDQGYEAKDTPICNFFNRQRFWTASSKEVIKVKKNGYATLDNSILTFASTSQKPITIFVKRSDVLGYNVTVEEWYAMLGPDYTIPSYLHKDDYISDYMVTVIAVEGDFTNYEKLSIDPTYSPYFDKNGLKVDNLSAFYQLKNVNVILQVDGCLIPDFKDNMGRSISIDRLVNNHFATTQLICAIDTDKLDEWDGTVGQEIDLIGNELVARDAPESLNMLSYNIPYFYKEESFGNIGNVVNDIIIGESPEELNIKCAIEVLKSSDSVETQKVIKLIENGILNDADAFELDGTIPGKIGIYPKFEKDSSISGYYIACFNDGGEVIEFQNYSGIKFTFNSVSQNLINSISLDKSAYNDFITPDMEGKFDYEQTPTSLTIKFDSEEEYQAFYTANCAKSKTDTKAPLRVGNYIKASCNNEDVERDEQTGKSIGEHSRILRILSISKQSTASINDTQDTSCKLVIKVKAATDAYIDGIDVTDDKFTVVSNIPTVCKSLKGIKLNEFKLRADLLPDGTPARQVKILEYMFENTNIASAICESELYDIRYIIDTYAGEMSANSKYNLSLLAAKHGKSMAFVNAPSMKQFEEWTDPSFLDTTTRLVSCEYIASGGNLDLNPSYTFGFATGTVKGVPIESFTYPVFPNLIINDNGTQKSMIPAPYACNAFMRKFQAGSPYSIVAGTQGKLTEQEIVGVEYEMTNDDRAWLEPMGYNLIVNKRRGGIMLYTNNTAYQTVKSALNNAHVRDTLITIEKNIENILYNFLFKFNTSVVRARVKSLVDDYLDGVAMAGGLAGYTTQIDRSNNDQYVLENNSAVIDITVDFNRGIHKFINKITITRVGGEVSVVSTGFTAI